MSYRRTSGYIILAILALLPDLSPLRAGEITAEVTYVAWRTLYLDAGRSQGIVVGASGLLYHESTLLGELTIAAAAESTCVATLSGDSVVARPGDRAVVLVENPKEEKLQSMDQSPMKPASGKESLWVTSRKKPRSRFTGRASVQTDIYQDNSGTEVNPGATFRSTISRVVTDNSHFSLKYRGRQYSYSETKTWQHRLYEAGLTFESAEQSWRASVGRIQAGSVAGIGYLDGVYGEAGIGKGFAVGAFGGTQAEVDLAAADWGSTKAGVLVTHRRNESSTRRRQMTIAMAGEYVDGNISREFIYQQCNLGFGGAFSLYESSDFNINRGWRREAEGSSVSLANVLANVRYTPVQFVTLSAGYDGRARYHDWETRETPDSLFDDAIRHGLRAGVELAFLRGTRLSAQQSYRSDPSNDAFYPSGSYSLTTNSILHGSLGASIRFNTFSNPYSTGELRSVSASWIPLRNADLRAEYGQTQYDYRLTQYRAETDWIRASLSLNLRSGTYVSLQTERNSAPDDVNIRNFIELGQRFR